MKEDPVDPPWLVLSYLDSELLTESEKKRLTWPEIKQVARCILEAFRIFHQDGIVHTGRYNFYMVTNTASNAVTSFLNIKLDNIFVNNSQVNQWFSKFRLGDCEGVVSQDSEYAKDADLIGAAFTRSPEATFQLSWGILHQRTYGHLEMR